MQLVPCLLLPPQRGLTSSSVEGTLPGLTNLVWRVSYDSVSSKWSPFRAISKCERVVRCWLHIRHLTRTHPISGGGVGGLLRTAPAPSDLGLAGWVLENWRAWQDSNLHVATVRVATYWSHRRDEPLGYHQLSDISERVRWPSFSTVSPDPAPESCSKVFYHPFSARW